MSDLLSKAIADMAPKPGYLVFDKNGRPEVNSAFINKKTELPIAQIIGDYNFLSLPIRMESK